MPGGNLDVERPLVEGAPRAVARLARMLDDAAGATALRARRGVNELAEHAAGHLPELAAAAAARTGRDVRAGLDAVAAAGVAWHRDLHGHAHGLAAGGLREVDLDLGGEIAAASRAATHAATEEVVAEERREEIADVTEIEMPWREAARAQSGVAVAIVELAGLAVREHLVGFGDLAEADFGIRLLGDVGMEAAREHAECLLDLLLVGVTRDAEQLVVVMVARRHYSSE